MPCYGLTLLLPLLRLRSCSSQW